MEDLPVPMFDPIRITLNEIQRRLVLLGDLIHEDKYDYEKFRVHSTLTGIRVAILKQWWESFKKLGPEGLKHDLSSLKPEEYPEIFKRRQQLGQEVENESISKDEIQAIANRNNWSYITAYRWVRRFRVGGEVALGKHHNPFKPSRKAHEATDLAGLNEDELAQVFEIILEWLGPLANQPRVKNSEFEKRSQELRDRGIYKSARTLRLYWSKLQRHPELTLGQRMASLTGKRHPKGYFGKINAEVRWAVRVLALTYPALPATRIQKEVEKWASMRGFEPPSEPQVRRICKQIPEALKLIAAGKYTEFRNKFKITYLIDFGFKVVFQIDWTQIPVYVKDIRHKRYRSRDGKVAAYLITVVEARSGKVLAWMFTYDRPDRFDIALVVRKALLAGGIPNELWPDFGRELIAEIIKNIARTLGFLLHPVGPDQPQQKGDVERPYETFETQHWAKTGGYYGHLENERERKKVAPKHTMAEIEADFSNYIEHDYNRTPHGKREQSPIEYWENNIITLSADPDVLDILMMEAHTRKVRKEGIRFLHRDYWHRDLAGSGVIGSYVLIRSPERYIAPDEIIVFNDKRERICTAFARDSEKGLAVSPEEIAAAQRDQMRPLRDEMKEVKVAASAMKADLQAAEAGEAKKAPQQSGGSKSKKTDSGKKREQRKTNPKISGQASVLKNLRNNQKKENPPPAEASKNEEDNNNG